MKIVLVCAHKIPVSAYSDKGRMVWWLGKELSKAGHDVSFLFRSSGACSFAKVLVYNDKKPLDEQIPDDTDLVHFHDEPQEEIGKPYLITAHENSLEARSYDPNTVFISYSQAQLHGGSVFVYPGVDFSDYSEPELDSKRLWYHFLGNTAQKGRNVQGAIDLAAKAGARLHVIGGSRVGFRKGFSIPLSPSARFHGTLSPDGRDALLNGSKGMIFPVIWQEPFSMGVIESLYFGCPIFGTPFGALPELLGKKIVSNSASIPINGIVEAFYSDYGCLSIKKSELLDALKHADEFDPVKCHEYVQERFSAQRMAGEYLKLYDKVLNNKPLHKKAPDVSEAVGDQRLTITA